MNPNDLDRIRFVTRHFDSLQGLRTLVPLGFGYLTVGVGDTVIFDLEATVAAKIISLVLLLATTIAATRSLKRWAKSYYSSRYGEIERQQVNPLSPRGQRIAIVLVLVFWGLFMRAAHQMPTPGPMPALLYLPFGVWCICIWLLRGSRLAQAHYLVSGLFLVGLATPLPVSNSILRAMRPMEARYLLAGAFMVVAGLLDHWVLVRTLKLAAEPGALPAGAPAQAQTAASR